MTSKNAADAFELPEPTPEDLEAFTRIAEERRAALSSADYLRFIESMTKDLPRPERFGPPETDPAPFRLTDS